MTKTSPKTWDPLSDHWPYRWGRSSPLLEKAASLVVSRIRCYNPCNPNEWRSVDWHDVLHDRPEAYTGHKPNFAPIWIPRCEWCGRAYATMRIIPGLLPHVDIPETYFKENRNGIDVADLKKSWRVYQETGLILCNRCGALADLNERRSKKKRKREWRIEQEKRRAIRTAKKPWIEGRKSLQRIRKFLARREA